MQTLTLIFIKPTKLASSERLTVKTGSEGPATPRKGGRSSGQCPCLAWPANTGQRVCWARLCSASRGWEPAAQSHLQVPSPAERRLPETGARGGLTSWGCTSKCARGQAGLITHNKLPAPAGPQRHSLEGSRLEKLRSICSVLPSPGHNRAQEEQSVLTHSGRTELQTPQSAEGHISLTGCPCRLSSGSYHDVCAPRPGRKSDNR